MSQSTYNPYMGVLLFGDFLNFAVLDHPFGRFGSPPPDPNADEKFFWRFYPDPHDPPHIWGVIWPYSVILAYLHPKMLDQGVDQGGSGGVIQNRIFVMFCDTKTPFFCHNSNTSAVFCCFGSLDHAFSETFFLQRKSTPKCGVCVWSEGELLGHI